MVTECRIQTAEHVFHYGMHRHSSISTMNIIQVDTPPTVAQCTQARDYISDTKTITTNMNKTTTTKYILVGRIYENGKCAGDNMMVNEASFFNMIHYKEFHVTIISYLAQFDSAMQHMRTNGYGFCKCLKEHAILECQDFYMPHQRRRATWYS